MQRKERYSTVVPNTSIRGSLLCSTVTPHISVPSCSKAPRGLFVHLPVGRIFTAISNSPSLLSRQLQSRYTFRAGRNLPDKEFRYHRTVIVTAAVHRGFSCSLVLLRALSHAFNLPALGRFQPVYFSFRFRTDLCFS